MKKKRTYKEAFEEPHKAKERLIKEFCKAYKIDKLLDWMESKLQKLKERK